MAAAFSGDPLGPSETLRATGLETLAWEYERHDVFRAFGYTGMHHHSCWGFDPVSRLVTNAVLWSSGLDFPSSVAPVTFDPAWLEQNLDPK